MDRIGRYKIERELGRGAMGVVYHAIDPNIGRPVAIKTIRLGDVGSTAERTRLRERLSREARSAGILSHPGIVTIYDVDQEGEVAYIAMEFVDGSTLDDVLSAPQPVTQRRVFSILGQTAVALDYAHQKGIVHRDIKPANIMITADGNVKIADFGIAKITASEQFTMTGTIVGTPHYMAPEQVQGQPVDGRADQFSLAVVAFEMLTGDKPFTGEQLTTVVYKIVAEEPPRVQRFNSTLTLQIEHVLRKGLAKKADARYKNCQEFVDALEDACASARNWRAMSRAAATSEPTLPAGAGPHLPPGRSPRGGDTTTDAPRRRSGMLPLLFGIVVAAGLVGAVAWQAAPWVSKQVPQPEAAPTAPAEPPAIEAQKPAPMPPAENTAESIPPATETMPEAPPAKEEATTADAPPVEPAPAPKPEAPSRSTTFPVLVPTYPPGATASLDDRADSACRTPCNLHASRGRHRVTITMAGHQPEHRQIDVTGTPLELPLVSLRAFGGTLMLSSAPPDAAIFIDDRKLSQSTPAQISLAPGTYNITVEKNGKRISERVEIRNGGTTYRKIPLDN